MEELVKLSDTEIRTLLTSKNANGDTIFFLACKNGDLKMIRFLMEKEVHLLDLDSNQNNILHRLAIGSNPEALREILLKLTPKQKEKLINATNTKGDTPLLIACEKGNTEIISILIENKADLFRTNL